MDIRRGVKELFFFSILELVDSKKKVLFDISSSSNRDTRRKASDPGAPDASVIQLQHLPTTKCRNHAPKLTLFWQQSKRGETNANIKLASVELRKMLC